ncbi:unnamed protein product, partial [Callosobruchus maculatus]
KHRAASTAGRSHPGQARTGKDQERQIEQEQREKLRNHLNKSLEVKQSAEETVKARLSGVAAFIEDKLTTALLKREEQIRRKSDVAKKYVNIASIDDIFLHISVA